MGGYATVPMVSHSDNAKRSWVTRRKGLIAAFWAKVDRSGGPESCWPWTGPRLLGRLYGLLERDGRKIYAHRHAWELTHGPIPDGLQACHHCDNPPCCNPAHLSLGTSADNHADMVSKGRGPLGTRNGMSRLTENDIRTIRRRYHGGETQATIGADYNMHQSGISAIVRKVRWQHVPDTEKD